MRVTAAICGSALLLFLISCSSDGGDGGGADDDGTVVAAVATDSPSGTEETSTDDCFRAQKADDNDVRVLIVNNLGVEGLSARVTSPTWDEEVFCESIRTDLAELTNVVISAEAGNVVTFAIRNDAFGVTFTFSCTLDSSGAEGDATVSFDWTSNITGTCESGFVPAVT
jgi:hypothetical protein